MNGVSYLHRLQQTLVRSERMPVVFIGHGNPMNAIMHNSFTREWATVGKCLSDAQAIVVISAHWLSSGTYVTSAEAPEILYDFYGFPPDLYEVTYNARGDAGIAEKIREHFLLYEAQLDATRGLDHGAWAILKHIAPNPSIPILQISLDISQSLTTLTEMFRSLQVLRERGVVFIGSGNIVHNLMAAQFSAESTSTDSPWAYDWALEFDTRIADAITDQNFQILTQPKKLGSITALAVPTDDHYRPLLATMALTIPGETFRQFNTSIDMASVSMRSFISVDV